MSKISVAKNNISDELVIYKPNAGRQISCMSAFLSPSECLYLRKCVDDEFPHEVVIYVLDKIVWMLLIAAVTAQALQMAGVVDTPKGLGDISYKQDNEYGFQVQVGGTDVRGKRQTDERSQFIDNLFNIPISTLTAVNNFVQSTRPAIRTLREYAVRGIDRANKAAQNYNQLRQQRANAVRVQNQQASVVKVKQQVV